MTRNEKLATTIATAALAVSIASSYLQFFWKQAELVVSFEYVWTPVRNFEQHAWDTGEGLADFHSTVDLTFTNTGNAKLAVTKITLFLPHEEEWIANSNAIPGNELPIEMKDCFNNTRGGSLIPWRKIITGNESRAAGPIIVGAGDVVVTRVEMLQEMIQLRDWDPENSLVTSCFRFEFTTGGEEYEVSVPAAQFGTNRTKYYEGGSTFDLL